MQIAKMFKAAFKPGRNILTTLVMVGVVASGLSLMPTHGAANTLAETCANPPAVPTFNYWPVTYADTNTPLCHDFPAIDAALDVTNPVFSQSETDWNDGLTMSVGQKGAALMYLHNGAANNLDQSLTTAKDVKITTQTDTSVGSSHQIKVTYSASNAASYTRTFTVKTPANAKLEVTPNSGALYTYEGTPISGQSGLNIGNSTFSLGDIKACFEFSLFLSFKFKVVAETPANPTITIDKGVANLTTQGGVRLPTYTSSVNANKGDQVGYKVTVTNNSSQVAKNVTMTDNGVNGITIDSGSTTVGISDAQPRADGWSGSIPGTVSLGDLNPGETRIIKYTGRVNVDCTTLVNTASAVATGIAAVSDTASVKVDNCDHGGSSKKITIKKWVKNNSTSTSYNDSSVNAKNGDRVNFKVTVTNTGDTTLNNVVMTDVIPSGLQFDDSVSGDGTASFNNTTFSVDFGTIRADDSKTVEFAARVTSNSNNNTICNTAKATATGVSQVQDDACVKITTNNSGTPNIVISKRAWNDTKNVDAQSVAAARGDYITYTLVATNTGSADMTNYVFEDDLSQVLPLADMVSTNGGKMSSTWIVYPSVTIKAGETVTKTFKVRIKQTLSAELSYQLRNIYGNTVVINVPGKVIYNAPKTGAAGTSAAAFAGLVTAGFVVARKRGSIMKFIFN